MYCKYFFERELNVKVGDKVTIVTRDMLKKMGIENGGVAGGFTNEMDRYFGNGCATVTSVFDGGNWKFYANGTNFEIGYKIIKLDFGTDRLNALARYFTFTTQMICKNEYLDDIVVVKELKRRG